MLWEVHGMNKKAGLLLAALLLTTPSMAMAMDTAPAADETAAAETAQAEKEVPFAAAVKCDGHWGVINARGQTVVPLIYDDVDLSLSDKKVRAADLASEENRNQYIEVKRDGKRGFYTREGKEVVPVSYEDRSTWQDGYLIVRNEDKKMAVYGENGLIASPADYDEISSFSDGMAVYKQDDSYGYISDKGVILPAAYDEANQFSEGLASVKQDGKWGVINHDGQVVVPFTYSDEGDHYSDGLLAVKQDGKWGFINTEGQVVVKPTYRAVIPEFNEGYTAVQSDKKLWGFVDKDGNEVIAPVYKAVYTPFSEGLAGVRTSDGKAYIKPDGTTAFMADFDQIYSFHDGIAEYRTGEVQAVRTSPSIPISIGIGIGWGGHHHHHHHHGGWGWGPGIGIGWYPWAYGWGDPVESLSIKVRRGYIDNTGRIIASAENDHVYPMTEEGALIKNKNRYGFINRKGDFLAHVEYRNLLPLCDTSLLVGQNEEKKWGALSMTDGTEKIPFTYDSLTYEGDGILAYEVDDKYGLVTADGNVLTQAIYQKIGTGGNDRFPAKKDGRWLYLDSTGKEVISLDEDVDEALSFQNGMAAVKKNGKWGLINTDGTWKVQPQYDEMKSL
jgi:hypothetical protein